MEQRPSLAHSADWENRILQQRYDEHVTNVVAATKVYAEQVGAFAPSFKDLLVECATRAAEFHDLGKLDDAIQDKLWSMAHERLPFYHVDAGVSYNRQFKNAICQIAAMLIASHHIGLPDVEEEKLDRKLMFRRSLLHLARRKGKPAVEVERYIAETIRRTDALLEDYLKKHQELFPQKPVSNMVGDVSRLFFRFALSCLIDADHSDTARHYGHPNGRPGPSLLPDKRLASLDKYVAALPKKRNKRNKLRAEIYDCCRHPYKIGHGMTFIDAPMGTGKTTAFMAYGFRVAKKYGCRRIFVIDPYTSIIDQTFTVYQKSLVLPGEHADDVVVPHHHRCDFGSKWARQYAVSWNAPIVCTTAVQFFETLGACRTAALRKIHNVPGSVIIIDESHASLPVSHWPLALEWLQELVEQWGCHLVFSSGTMQKFWELKEFSQHPFKMMNLIKHRVHKELVTHERKRVKYQVRPDPLSLSQFVKWVNTKQFADKRRVVVVNTVQSCAAIARMLARKYGREKVEHLSTALTPKDRDQTTKRIEKRLATKEPFILVATSCVECGLDFDFDVCFRERCSLCSLVQIGGRVNRESRLRVASIWDFQLSYDAYLVGHPKFQTSRAVLGSMLERGEADPWNVTEALRRELSHDGMERVASRLLKAEHRYEFPAVDQDFNVIAADTATVIVNPEIADKVATYDGKVSFRDIIPNSVQIWVNKIEKFGLEPVLQDEEGRDKIYRWPYDYDDFLGVMAGILRLIDIQALQRLADEVGARIEVY
jgi:CRISPR-associated endonuclease/helicase Cas3